MNNIIQLISMAKNGANPMQMLNSMANTNPQIRQVMALTNGKSENELKTIANNLAKNRGTSVDDVMRNLGL